MFSFKFSIHDVTRNGEIDFIKQYSAWKQQAPKRSNPVRIRAYIYQCQDLPAADAEGTSDPFVVAWDISSETKKTKVVEDNCNPLFYETLELDYEVDNVDDLYSYPPFIFDVYDYDDDLFDSTPDYLGRAVIEPEDCAIVMQKEFETCKDHG
jgi:Ca2+-dependent lipid-binding protein